MATTGSSHRFKSPMPTTTCEQVVAHTRHGWVEYINFCENSFKDSQTVNMS